MFRQWRDQAGSLREFYSYATLGMSALYNKMKWVEKFWGHLISVNLYAIFWINVLYPLNSTEVYLTLLLTFWNVVIPKNIEGKRFRNYWWGKKYLVHINKNTSHVEDILRNSGLVCSVMKEPVKDIIGRTKQRAMLNQALYYPQCKFSTAASVALFSYCIIKIPVSLHFL